MLCHPAPPEWGYVSWFKSIDPRTNEKGQITDNDGIGYAVRDRVADLRVETVGTTIVRLIANTTRGEASLEMYVDLEDPPIYDADHNCGMIVLTIDQLPSVLDEARLAGLTIGGEPR